MVLHRSGIRKGKIADALILANCSIMIKKYIDRMNKADISGWTVGELKSFLLSDGDDISFSNFARVYIRKIRGDGRKNPANNYTVALNFLEKFHGKPLDFSDITSKMLREWIMSMSGTKRAKQLYPTLIKKIFDEGCLEYNDYEKNIIRIPNQPFKAVKIPQSDEPDKRSIEIERLRKILEAKPVHPREELAHDVALLVLYLAGINTVDLYNLEKQEFAGGKICYNRTKTENKRRDKAYMEISVHNDILPLFERYRGKKYLFNFRERYSDPNNFSKAVNKGLKILCTKAQIRIITVYWLRHTWATTARNLRHWPSITSRHTGLRNVI
jgi:integrase